jgi:hypothetical protein
MTSLGHSDILLVFLDLADAGVELERNVSELTSKLNAKTYKAMMHYFPEFHVTLKGVISGNDCNLD